MNGAPGHLRARLKLPPLLLLMLLLTLVVMMMVMWMAVSREIGGGSGRTVRTSTLLTTRGQHAPQRQASNVAIYTAFRKQVIAPRGRRDDMPPPACRWQFDSRRTYVRPRTVPQPARLRWPASCRQPACSAVQRACYSLVWDRRTDRGIA